MRRTVSMREALDDPQLLGDALIGDSWSTLAGVPDRAHGRAAHRVSSRHHLAPLISPNRPLIAVPLRCN
jgi:hypothetical protein